MQKEKKEMHVYMYAYKVLFFLCIFYKFSNESPVFSIT